MRMGQGVRTGLGHGGITCVLQTQFSSFFFFGWGWSVGEYEHESRHILYTRHIITTTSTEPYSLMKIFLTLFKIEGIVALTIKGR